MAKRFRFQSLTVCGSRSEMASAISWIKERALNHGLIEENLSRLESCAEKFLSNIQTHSSQAGSGEIQLELLLDQNNATLTLIDKGDAYDPAQFSFKKCDAATAVQNQNIFDSGVNKNFTEEIRYERQDQINRLTVRIGPGLSFRNADRRKIRMDRFPTTLPSGQTITQNRRTGVDRRELGFISKTAIFKDIPYGEVNRILARCEVRLFGAEEILLHAGEFHRCVLIVIEGSLEIRLDGPTAKYYVKMGPGEVVGEMSVADGKPSSAWVVGETEGRVLVIPETVFLKDILGSSAISRNVICMMSQRMRKNDEHIVARFKATLELEVLQRELDTARYIQSSMLPSTKLFSAEGPIVGRGYMRCARQVGGDFYDAIELGNSRYFVAIGDVCGKGTPAALFMVRTLTMLRSEAVRVENDDRKLLMELAGKCNDRLCEANSAEQFVTIFCAIINTQTHTISYINLGHNPPLIRLPDGEVKFIADSHINPFIGLMPDMDFVAYSMEFNPGSLLLLYTDGVTEAENESGDFFGEEILCELIRKGKIHSVDQSINRVVSAIETFTEGYVQSDDITMLAAFYPVNTP